SGSYPMYRYTGIAPEANLVIVKLPAPTVMDSYVIDGVRYVFQKAASLGMDCVVLVAWGHDQGAHDGTCNLDVALSALTGPGHIVVAAAGNHGGQAMHSHVNLGSGQSSTVTLSIPPYNTAAG